jgi:hypothetical protein
MECWSSEIAITPFPTAPITPVSDHASSGNHSTLFPLRGRCKAQTKQSHKKKQIKIVGQFHKEPEQ